MESITPNMSPTASSNQASSVTPSEPDTEPLTAQSTDVDTIPTTSRPNIPQTNVIKPPHTGADSQHYGHETVLVLLSMMSKAGYGDRRLQKKSLKDVFIKEIELAQIQHGIKRSPKAWQKKFTRMKQEYSAFIAKISESGRDGDDPDLFDKPGFYEQLHELERNKARHDPPALLCSDTGSVVSDDHITSTRKRAKLSHNAVLESYMEEQTKHKNHLLTGLRKAIEEKAKLRKVMERLLEKF